MHLCKNQPVVGASVVLWDDDTEEKTRKILAQIFGKYILYGFSIQQKILHYLIIPITIP